MAATFQWCEANGPDGTVTEGVNNADWKSVDDATTPPESAPLQAGSNSFDKWQYGAFSGSYTLLTGGWFAHTDGALGPGLALFGSAPMMSEDDQLTYSRPSRKANERLTADMTEPKKIEHGTIVWFGPGSPDDPGKAASTRANPAFTNYLTTQLRVGGSTMPGDTETVVLTLRYDEA